MAAGPSIGSLLTGGYKDPGSQVTPAQLAGDTHLTQHLLSHHVCQCLAQAGLGRGSLRSPAKGQLQTDHSDPQLLDCPPPQEADGGLRGPLE